jgi:hypothetical protein
VKVNAMWRKLDLRQEGHLSLFAFPLCRIGMLATAIAGFLFTGCQTDAKMM